MEMCHDVLYRGSSSTIITVSFLNPERACTLEKFLFTYKNYSEAAIIPQGCISTSANQSFTSSNVKERSQKRCTFLNLQGSRVV